MKLGVLIPALNEQEKIEATVKNIPKKVQGISKIFVLVVDDGSRDKTPELAKQAGAEVISHSVNKGVGAAFQTGLDWALRSKIDFLVNIDADGQFNPNDIPKLVEPIITDSVDVVVADRFEKGRPKNMSSIKYFGNKLMTYLINTLSHENFTDVSSGFRAFNRESLLKLNLHGQFTYTQESFLDLASKDIRIMNMPVEVKYFPQRKSRVAGNIFKYAVRTSVIIFRSFRDYQPMRFFGILGLLIFTLGLMFDLFVARHYILTRTFSPYIFVIFTGAYLNTIGLGIIVLGILADMQDRIRLNQEKLLYYAKKNYYKD